MITLATLPQATEQEVFDQVVTHLLTQGQKCQEYNDGLDLVCVYRNSDGQSCAAGCLIGFGEYREELFEGKSWQVLIDEETVPKNHKKLISRLQSIHDNTLAEYWHNSLKDVAKTFNLSTIVLDKEAKENNFIQ